MRLIIGEDVRIVAARDLALLGRKGTVVMETMHTLTIKTSSDSRKLVLPKNGSALQLADGAILLGDVELKGRLEDRVAIATTNRTRMAPATAEGRADRRFASNL
jgi:RNase P/RNase MRP subunit p29